MDKICQHFAELKESTLEPAYLIDAYKASREDNNAKFIADYFTKEGLLAKYISPKEANLFVSDTPGNAQVLEEAYK